MAQSYAANSSASGYSGFFSGILEFDVSGTGNSELASIRSHCACLSLVYPSNYPLASSTFDSTNDDVQVVAPMTVYNLGGGRNNSCSILEAIQLIEKISNKKSKYKVLKQNRIGDHIWWITDNSKFKKEYPKWKISISLKQSIEQMVEFEFNNK